jgi:hypothetical protein
MTCCALQGGWSHAVITGRDMVIILFNIIYIIRNIVLCGLTHEVP